MLSMGSSCSGHPRHLPIPDFHFLIHRYLRVDIFQLRKEMTETQTGEVKFAQGDKEGQGARLSIPDHPMPGSFPLTAVSTLLQTQLPPLLSSLPLFADLLSYEVSLGVCVSQSCPTLCDPTDCSLPGSSVHETLQARILEWVVISSSRGSSLSRD